MNRRVGGLLGLLLGLVPVTALSNDARGIRQGLADCERDGAALWLAPKPEIGRLLVLRSTAEPVDQNGDLYVSSPDLYSINTDIPMIIEELGLSSVDVHLHGVPRLQVSFGPAQDGVYRVSIHNEGEPECRDYEAYLRRWRAERDMPDGAYPELVSGDRCLAFERVGAWPKLEDYTHVMVAYADSRASAAGYFRQVEELRGVEGTVFARALLYAFPPPFPQTCAANESARGMAYFLHDD